ncbi:hypothetical protein ABL78_3466 [Leptomonas seymouri]|uniref:Uncharacterized protein n=1 Tax=Leptomonas seymouri TaxID=5684 RepID=A0A0N1PC43_LEPSE|nr:hypothetical protein ABL78_3466 [Leptomonas seymouri]|eukprot:KPI87435.1 hypothetical protein ABL78_3466 [Leptomonas seymouri]
MHRVVTEQRGLRDAPSEVFLRVSSAPRATRWQTIGGATVHADPAPTQQRSELPATKVVPSFYTATSLYRSHLPTGSCTDRSAEFIGDRLSTPTRLTSLSPTRRRVSSTPSWPPRAVPSPKLYEILAETSLVQASKRYPTPPWWQEAAEVVGEEEEETQVMRRNVGRPAAHMEAAAHHQKYGDASAHVGCDYRSCRDVKLPIHNERKDEVRVPSTPTRSRTCSVAAHRLSRTASPSPTHPATEGESPVRFAEVVTCGPLPCMPRLSSGAMHNTNDREQRLSPSAETSGINRKQQPSHTDSVFQLYGNASTGTTAPSTITTATARLAHTSTQRLRINKESAAHPSGFSVPRRGPGEAAPRTLYNGLAALPATAADHHAVGRAKTSGQASAIYGAGNHPSTYNVQEYRHGVAVVTGVDPARLREGILNQRYMRVHSGWVEAVGERDSVAGTRLHHTTTRLRLGLRGGGAPRGLELHDPISGQSRKPNEVSTAYLAKAVREGEHANARVQGRDVGVRSALIGGPVADGDGDRLSLTRCDQWEGQRSLTLKRRVRANARPLALHATHDATGVPLSTEDRRLYWAEHAPLHHAAVRGLNALLQGVGEAEPDCESASISTRGESEFFDGSSTRGRDMLQPHEAANFPAYPSHNDRHPPKPARDPQHHSDANSMGSAAIPHHAQRLGNTHARPSMSDAAREAGVAAHLRSRSLQTDVDPARAQLQDALRQRLGPGRPLTTSLILPAAYRRSVSPARTAREELFDAADATEHENGVFHDCAIRRDWAEGCLSASGDAAGDGTMGLVDSHMLHGTSGSSLVEKTTSSDTRSNYDGYFEITPSHSDGGHHPLKNTVTVRPAAAARRSFSRSTRHRVAADELPSHGVRVPVKGVPLAPLQEHAAFIFPPMMTPLLQEVDECLRFHRLPVMRDIWQWKVADQTALLRSAGFSAAECQTITWELERMIRATSTMCTVAV